MTGTSAEAGDDVVVVVLDAGQGLLHVGPVMVVNQGNGAGDLAIADGRVCEALSGDFGLHMLRVTRTTTTSVIRTSYSGANVRSKLNRDPTRSQSVAW